MRKWSLRTNWDMNRVPEDTVPTPVEPIYQITATRQRQPVGPPREVRTGENFRGVRLRFNNSGSAKTELRMFFPRWYMYEMYGQSELDITPFSTTLRTCHVVIGSTRTLCEAFAPTDHGFWMRTTGEIDLPANANFELELIYQTTGQFAQEPPSYHVHPIRNERSYVGSTLDQVQSLLSGVNPSNTDISEPVWGPNLIVGLGVPSGPTMLVLNDSIGHYTPNTNYGVDDRGNMGFIARYLDTNQRVPYHFMSGGDSTVSGELIGEGTESRWDNLKQVEQWNNGTPCFSNILIQTGGYELGDAAGMSANLTQLIQRIRAIYEDIPIFAATLLPQTDSTDQFVTLDAQTVRTNAGPNLTLYNTELKQRTDLAGIIDIAGATGITNDKWPVLLKQTTVGFNYGNAAGTQSYSSLRLANDLMLLGDNIWLGKITSGGEKRIHTVSQIAPLTTLQSSYSIVPAGTLQLVALSTDYAYRSATADGMRMTLTYSNERTDLLDQTVKQSFQV